MPLLRCVGVSGGRDEQRKMWSACLQAGLWRRQQSCVVPAVLGVVGCTVLGDPPAAPTFLLPVGGRVTPDLSRLL